VTTNKRKTNQSAVDVLTREMLRNVSESKLTLFRNMSYGGGGVCIVIVGFILQSANATAALTIATYCAAVAMPFWIGAGAVLEAYLSIGKKAYPHYRSEAGQSILGGFMLFAMLPTYGSIALLLLHLSELSAVVFVISTVCAIAAYSFAMWHLGRSRLIGDGKTDIQKDA
jgi:hypothetical protein